MVPTVLIPSNLPLAKLLGATNPANALAGTLRADYADSLTENGTHGSDSVESDAREFAYFFGEG